MTNQALLIIALGLVILFALFGWLWFKLYRHKRQLTKSDFGKSTLQEIRTSKNND